MLFENVLIRDFFYSKIYDMFKHNIEKNFIPNCISIFCGFINCDLTIYNIKSTDNLDENKFMINTMIILLSY